MEDGMHLLGYLLLTSREATALGYTWSALEGAVEVLKMSARGSW